MRKIRKTLKIKIFVEEPNPILEYMTKYDKAQY